MTSPTNHAGQEPEIIRAVQRVIKDCEEGAAIREGNGHTPDYARALRSVASQLQSIIETTVTPPLDGSGKGTPEIIDPEGLKGGPGAQAKLREYYGKFRALGDNPPMVVAENGEAILSMMWPVRDNVTDEQCVMGVKALALELANLKRAGDLFDADIVELLSQCQQGRMTCIYAAQVIEGKMQSALATAQRERDEARTMVTCACLECFNGIIPMIDGEGEEIGSQDCLMCEGSGWLQFPQIIAQRDELQRYKDSLPAVWQEDSSLATWFPYTAKEMDKLRSERDAALAQVAEIGRANGWQPMATAPKDGTNIMTFPHFRLVHWVNMAMRQKEGWAMGWDFENDNYIVCPASSEPTHWQHLPPCPPPDQARNQP